MLAQISPTVTATAGIIVALITAAAAIIKKLLGRKSQPKPECITRLEFHDSLDKVRDRIDALADKLDQQHTNLLTAIECQGANFEHRLDCLDSAVARLDERTKSF